MFFWNFPGIFPTSLHMILWHPVLMLFSLFSFLLIFLLLTLWPHQNLSNSSLFRNFWLRILFNQGADCLHQVSVLSKTVGGQVQVSVRGLRFQCANWEYVKVALGETSVPLESGMYSRPLVWQERAMLCAPLLGLRSLLRQDQIQTLSKSFNLTKVSELVRKMEMSDK